MKKFRVIYLGKDEKSVAEIINKDHYAVIGNGNTFLIKQLKRVWGKNARWGRYIKLP